MDREILLSVVIATYNRLPELRAVLASLLPQTKGQPVEVIIVDDRSTDNTWTWLQESLGSLPGVACLRMEKNGGPGPARNLGLSIARGRFFVPIDSDFLVTAGAIERILRAVRVERGYHLLYFPCLQSPGLFRLDQLSGRCEVTCESLLTGNLGELVAVADLAYMRTSKLTYPALRAGGEAVLWARILAGGPALFLDTPVALYRTDVPGRICTLTYQMEHPDDLAVVADQMVALFPSDARGLLKSARMRKSLAAGSYHLLAGNLRVGRRRLLAAAREGHWPAAVTLVASFGGRRLFRALFQFYRTRIQHAYL